ncbi:FxsA family protein [Gorillibacterium massiliense]|uniref:FxsA family protein n=1 Tax=Gorillibacterium massiliense TaxID=1280390 RepID=UPI0004B8C1C6|nr:FxsA family protein [Gorillibacterium massiliense]
MFRWLLILFIGIPALEIWGLVTMGRWIGGWQTVVFVLLISAVGTFIARREARLVWREAADSLSRGQLPAGPLLEGLCILAGGLLLILPGFFTDIIGLFLLLPLTRPLARGILLKLLMKQIEKGSIRFYK